MRRKSSVKNFRRKRQFYQRYGVEEYYIYEPDDGALEGWRRVVDRLEQIPRMAGFVSPRLGIRFDPGEGSDNLTIFAPDGTRFLTFTEWVEKSKTNERRAEAEHQRAEAADRRAVEQTRLADAERQRAEAIDQRAERLAARLRELGIEPE